MNGVPAAASTVQASWAITGNLGAQVRETHTGIVVLLGDKAYKAKKPITTDFLDFSTPDRRVRACEREVELNSRLAPDSYLGVGHFAGPQGGPAEPVIVMRRYGDSTRLASLVHDGEPVRQHLCVIADLLAGFHGEAARGPAIDAQGTVSTVMARWQQNLAELQRYADSVIPRASIGEAERLATQFASGRSVLFAQRISDRRIVDGHADLLADDIFCLPDGPALLDCLEFDDHLRYVDGIDDAAFLAMDLEFLGRKDLGDYFLDEYSRRADDPAAPALKDFYIAYRAGVRAKVDCVRVAQGHREAAADAHRHMEIALQHLRAGTVVLVVISGGPGTGKTTLAHALAERLRAQVISTDDVRRQLRDEGSITGRPASSTPAYMPPTTSPPCTTLCWGARTSSSPAAGRWFWTVPGVIHANENGLASSPTKPPPWWCNSIVPYRWRTPRPESERGPRRPRTQLLRSPPRWQNSTVSCARVIRSIPAVRWPTPSRRPWKHVASQLKQGRWSISESPFGPSPPRPRLPRLPAMTYVIGSGCVDVMDKSCVQECPVDCIYEGDRVLYINPDECVDCGACKLICRVEAIYYETDLPEDQQQHLADNAAFFSEILPGSDGALGSPGGAAAVGRVGVDTPLVAAMPRSSEEHRHV
jgi:aminoglycoside phosphotransferase family enzyme/NAD-dependent dihydropyrimidine dehydrogenase PreA subunit